MSVCVCVHDDKLMMIRQFKLLTLIHAEYWQRTVICIAINHCLVLELFTILT